QPLSAVRAPRMAQATPRSGAAQASAPEAPLCPNESSPASGGAQCGAFRPSTSGPNPHGQGDQISGATKPPPRSPVWLRIASERSAGLRKRGGALQKARTSANAPSTVVTKPAQGSASDRQNGELNGSRPPPACSPRASATTAGGRGNSAPK